MNKSDLYYKLAEAQGIPVEESTKVVDAFFKALSAALLRGDRVEIRGFCSWQPKEYKGYIGRNPMTGETVVVPPKRLPFFKAGKDLAEHVNKPLPEADQADGAGKA